MTKFHLIYRNQLYINEKRILLWVYLHVYFLGWINFRMRAMLVSFAAYNLWLDWRRFGSHLARCFLDYEPGIHYPQLQMQSGVTGINAMRVYSVTKQAKDQDPDVRR